mmetsp:Transcript_37089/g.106086  ORF Transcript_37089/g.106086 Transcript_37089/m.106086 type:complete len:320 (+) Transcript_37089:36-995(+)|eukprot:CAMPEP_0168401822 /NCGR_PEP_ID=MMETSP0228-20121227/23305_1 /TAXON_ID=133427 /ORGANISM="Protoceratium reticulatum, Strain CCCM 535 (=CCMP 1889)" /LENGTH=319 /DNA_ID=CAMNT_0008415393 /DNA_START=14 /DNA_END=973 /DNA_ORIENTATION=+
MGCGAGVKPPRVLDPGEVKELCAIGTKEMEILCVKQAMAREEDIKVRSPDCINQHRENVKRLRAAAEEAPRSITEVTGADAVQELVGDQANKGGVFGKVLGMAAGALDKVAELTGEAAGKAVEKSLSLMADALEKAVDAIEKPFSEVGKDIVKEKHNDILGVFSDYINKQPLPDVVKLCRGEPPHGIDEYAACPGNSISAALTSAAVVDLAKPLLAVTQDEIKKHTITNAWDTLIKTTQSAHDAVSKYAALERFGIETTDLDMNTHIATETILAIGNLMGEEETTLRKSPEGKSSKPLTFAAVFSGETLTEVHLKRKDN